MFWMNLLLDLVLSLMLNPAAECLGGCDLLAEREMVHAPACLPAPQYMTPAPMNLPLGYRPVVQPCGVACAPICNPGGAPAAMPCMPPAPLPPVPVPNNNSGEVYEVRVKLLFDQIGGRGGLTCPCVTLPAHARTVVGMHTPGRAGMIKEQRLHLSVEPTQDQNAVMLNMKLEYPGKKERMGTQSLISLDTVTGVVLGGDGQEPVCAEVRVSRSNPPTPPAPVAPPTCPYPMYAPPCPPMVVGWPVPQMPYTVTPVAHVQPARSLHIDLRREDGKSQLRVAGHGSCTSSTRLKMDTQEVGTLRLVAGKKLVHIEGKSWRASAERIDVQTGRLVLSGSVKVTSELLGEGGEMKCDRCALHIHAGQLQRIGKD